MNAIDPDLALGVVRTLDELRDRSRAGPADMASQFATIGGLALVFSGVGLYSAMAYAVRRRTQEIAVRMALGAQATQVRWLFLKTGAWVIIAGVILGVPAALVVGRLLQNTFVRTEARDPVTLIVTVALLAIVALVASIVPARRATRLEPTAALRNRVGTEALSVEPDAIPGLFAKPAAIQPCTAALSTRTRAPCWRSRGNERDESAAAPSIADERPAIGGGRREAAPDSTELIGLFIH